MPDLNAQASDVQVPLTPTQMLTAPKSATAVDSRGRRITVMPLTALEHYRLTQFGARSDNPATSNYELMAASVCGINDEQFPRPATKLQLEAMIQRLDFDGFAAVAEALGSLAPERDDAAKNLAATQASE